MGALTSYRYSPHMISAPNHHRSTPMQSAQGWRSQTEGKKQEANGGKPAVIRAVQAFPCHGGGSAAFQFYSSSFSVHNTGSLVLS